MSNLMKIRPVKAELFHADGRTDGRRDKTDRRTNMTQIIVAIPQFLNFRFKGLK